MKVKCLAKEYNEMIPARDEPKQLYDNDNDNNMHQLKISNSQMRRQVECIWQVICNNVIILVTLGLK